MCNLFSQRYVCTLNTMCTMSFQCNVWFVLSTLCMYSEHDVHDVLSRQCVGSLKAMYVFWTRCAWCPFNAMCGLFSQPLCMYSEHDVPDVLSTQFVVCSLNPYVCTLNTMCMMSFQHNVWVVLSKQSAGCSLSWMSMLVGFCCSPNYLAFMKAFAERGPHEKFVYSPRYHYLEKKVSLLLKAGLFTIFFWLLCQNWLKKSSKLLHVWVVCVFLDLCEYVCECLCVFCICVSVSLMFVCIWVCVCVRERCIQRILFDYNSYLLCAFLCVRVVYMWIFYYATV